MALVDTINTDIKEAMKAKDKEKLESLRAIKSAILLAATEKGNETVLTEEAEIKLLSKLVKQRKETADLYISQNRSDLAAVELAQAEVIGKYLPKMLSEEEVKNIIQEAITTTAASSPSDMGKVMGIVVKKVQGKADGKLISQWVKEMLA